MTDKRATRAQHKRHTEAADWVFRNREPGRSAGDEAAFRQWLSRDPENCRAYDAAERLLGEAGTAIKSNPELRDFEVKPANLTKLVAGVVTALVAAVSLVALLDGPLYLQADRVARTDEMPIMTLSDGSRVQLNASSAIAFDYDEKHRSVRLLRGQAFFEVAKDQNRPFVVAAGDTHVTALGTAFDVRIGSSETNVTVTESTVRVETGDSGNNAVRVTEGQQVVVDRNSGSTAIRDVDRLVALAWRRRQLAVDNAPLSLVVEEMNRHFAGRIMLVGDDVAKRRVSGTIAVTNTNSALHFIEQVLSVKVTRIGPLVIIRG